MVACSGKVENYLQANINLNCIENFTSYFTVNNQILHYKRKRLTLYMKKLVIHSEIHIKHVTMDLGRVLSFWIYGGTYHNH
jgi:hypothetical protein